MTLARTTLPRSDNPQKGLSQELLLKGDCTVFEKSAGGVCKNAIKKY
jgi:hypothetical protein